MRSILVALMAVPLLAASPARPQFTLAVPPQGDLPLFGGPTPTRTPNAGGAGFAPAPLPNRDVGPPRSAASNGPRVSPSLFARSETYRGEAFSPGSTAQSDQDKRSKPAAGFALHMPLTDQPYQGQ